MHVEECSDTGDGFHTSATCWARRWSQTAAQPGAAFTQLYAIIVRLMQYKLHSIAA